MFAKLFSTLTSVCKSRELYLLESKLKSSHFTSEFYCFVVLTLIINFIVIWVWKHGSESWLVRFLRKSIFMCSKKCLCASNYGTAAPNWIDATVVSW